MDNDYTGDTDLSWAGGVFSLRYDWKALAALRTKFGREFMAHIGKVVVDPFASVDDFAAILAAGAGKTVEEVFAASPPFHSTINAVTVALGRAFHGGKHPEPDADIPPEMAAPKEN